MRLRVCGLCPIPGGRGKAGVQRPGCADRAAVGLFSPHHSPSASASSAAYSAGSISDSLSAPCLFSSSRTSSVPAEHPSKSPYSEGHENSRPSEMEVMGMEHTLRISVSKEPASGGIVSCRLPSLSRFFRLLCICPPCFRGTVVRHCIRNSL